MVTKTFYDGKRNPNLASRFGTEELIERGC